MSPRENVTECVRVRLRSSVKAAVEEAAESRNMLASEFIRMAIENELKRERRKIVRLERGKAS